METPRITPVDPDRPDPAALEEARALLARGEPVIVPTETVYGLACRPDIPGAVARIYQAKGRPETKPLPRMVATAEQVRGIVRAWPDAAERLAAAYWPGPLTLILHTSDGTIGFRIPDHPVIQALLMKVAVPLAVTSANRSGDTEALTAQDAAVALSGHVPLALDAGPARGGIPSTVVDLSGPDVRILREGAISSADILRVVDTAHPPR